MQLGNTVHFNSFKWVKEELRQLLVDIQRQLEFYINAPEDVEKLDDIIAALRQVRGTLSLVEIYGAALLSEEMEMVARALKADEIPNRDNAYETLLNASLRLPDYLDGLAVGNKDVPMVLLPLLNDLRACRNASLLSENVLFFPDVSVAAGSNELREELDGAKTTGEDVAELARKIRHQYQLGLLGWFKDKNVEKSFAKMHDVINRLRAASGSDKGRRLWWVSTAIVESLQHTAIDSSVALKSLMGKVDRQIKRLADLDEQEFSKTLPDDLTKNLLYYVANSGEATETIAKVKSAFNLEKYLPGQDDLADAERRLGGPNQELLDKVSEALQEEINQAKDALEVFTHSAEKDKTQLEKLVPLYSKIADTLGMLGLGRARQNIIHEKEELDHMLSGPGVPSEEALMSSAGVLLTIEGELEAYVTRRVDSNFFNETEEDESVDYDTKAAAENQRVVNSLVNESLKNIALVKDVFLTYIDHPENVEGIQSIPSILKELAGAMFVAPLDAVVPVIEKQHSYFATLIESAYKPRAQEQDAVADVVTNIECFLEAVAENRVDSELYVAAANDAVDRLNDISRGQPGAEKLPQETDEEVLHDDDVILVDDLKAEPVSEKDIAPAVTSESAKPAAVKKAAEPPPPPIPQRDYSDLRPIGDDADEEIIDIFIEESLEELQKVSSLYPVWSNNANDRESLTTIRRSFHTLKGSGRLVGATIIGEFAWSIENMLNRLIDGAITESPALFGVIEEAIGVLPQLIEQIRGNNPEPVENVYGLMHRAELLAAGHPVEETPAIESSNKVDIQPAFDTAVQADAPVDLPDETPVIEADDDLAIVEIEEVAIDDVIDSIDTGVDTPSGSMQADGTNQEEIQADAEGQVDSEADSEVILTSDYDEISALDDADQVIESFDADAAVVDADAIVIDDVQDANDTSLPDIIDPNIVTPDITVAGEPPAAANVGEGTTGKTAIDYTDEYLSIHVDPALLDIFSDEAETHLTEISRIGEKAREGTISARQKEAMIRAMHTLHGSARTAKFMLIAEKAKLLEQHANNLAELGVPWSPQELDLLDNTVDYVRNCIAHLKEHTAELVDDVDLNRALEQCVDRSSKALELERQTRLEKTGFVEEVEIDAELIEIFMEEAPDLVDTIEHELQSWKESDYRGDQIAEIMRQLHTLKGSARMASLSDFGDLSHTLESLFISVSSGNLSVTPGLEVALTGAVDRLLSMLDVMAQGRQPSVPESYLQQLDDIRLGKLDPDDLTKTISVEVPPDEAVKLEPVVDDEVLVDVEEPPAAESYEAAADEPLEPLEPLMNRLSRLRQKVMLSLQCLLNTQRYCQVLKAHKPLKKLNLSLLQKRRQLLKVLSKQQLRVHSKIKFVYVPISWMFWLTMPVR